MPEGERNLRQQIQEQTVRTARDFFVESLGRLEDTLRGDRLQLENLAEQLQEGDTEARIRALADSYSKLEESLHRAARGAGAEDAGGTEGAERGARDAVGAAAGVVTGGVGQAVGQVGQIAGDAQEVVGGVLNLIGQVTENLPGGQLLSRTTDEAGRTVQRAVDESGVVFEITLDEAGDLVEQNPVGNLAELPAEEEYQNEEGQTIRTVRDESGTLIELLLGEDGSILELRVLPSSET